MANSRFYQFLFSKVPMLTMLEGQVTIGASGAVSAYAGAGIYAVTKLTTGIYKIQTIDNFNAFIGALFSPLSGVVGSNITAGSFVTGTLYQITAVGSTNWLAIGLNTGLTAAVGQVFVATGVGSGTGTAKVVGSTGCDFIEVPQDPQKMLSPSTQGQGAIVLFQNLSSVAAAFTGDTHSNTTIDNLSSVNGLAVGQAIFGAGIPLGATIATLNASGSSLTISAAATATAATVPMTASPAKQLAHPANGSIIRFSLLFRNSSVSY